MKVFVVPHDPTWKEAFDRESQRIHEALGEFPIELHHIGSTSIPGILAKPIIDLLGAVEDLAALDAHNIVLERLGYQAKGAFGIAGRRYFRKGNASGTRTHHLHVFEHGSQHFERHIAFRDFLRTHPAEAAEYSELKARVTAAGNVTSDAYMDAKGPFIVATEKLALDWYRKRAPEG